MTKWRTLSVLIAVVVLLGFARPVAAVAAPRPAHSARARLVSSDATTLTVNSTLDLDDATPGDGLCAIAANPSICTLRAAIEENNANTTISTIAFAVRSGPVKISPTSALPPISKGVLIDGSTQPGYAGLPIVELNGAAAGAGADGLSGEVDVNALVVDQFSGAGIVAAIDDAIVTSSFIGTDPTGTLDRGNGGPGISISGEHATIGGPTIGGPLVGTGNLISGNNGGGIVISRQPPNSFTAALIEGNLIGTTLNGQSKLGNTGAGVTLGSNSGADRVGVSGSGNIIGGNTGDGVLVSASTIQSGPWSVDGNFIGTDTTGTDNLGNAGTGVKIGSGLVSGADASVGQNAKNVIAFNAGVGIDVLAGRAAVVSGNSVFSNGGIAIDLNGDGVTANDSKDADTGPNNLQNFPVLSAPVFSNNVLQITVNLNSSPNHQFRINYYSATTCNSGRVVFPDVATKTADANGNIAAFSETLSGVDTAPGHFITATATDIQTSTQFTSELSACLFVPFPHTFTVTNVGDLPDTATGDGVCATAGQGCTLRAAIQQANASVGDDKIAFAISSGPHTIIPTSALPTITDQVTIDATTQPGFAGTPIIELDGGSEPPGTNGLNLSADQSTIRGFVINRFPGHGIEVDGNSSGSGNAHIETNFVGTATDGHTVSANGRDGIILRSSGNVVGGTTTARNVVSGNTGIGIEAIPLPGKGSITNAIESNFIGTDQFAAPVAGNGGAGVSISAGINTTIGGPAAAQANVIGANQHDGVDIAGSSNTLLIRNVFLLNTGAGINVTTSTNTTVGGRALAAGNVISGSNDAIDLIGAAVVGTVITANVLGATTGTTPANKGNGVYISNARNTRIGGTLPVERNFISLNAKDGVQASGSSATGLLIEGNLIGVDATGVVARPNGVDGVFVQTPGAIIGGTAVGAANVISGNTHAGVVVSGATAAGTTLLGNIVGLGSDGLFFVGNGDDGIAVSGAPGVVIGGADPGEGNTVSGNSSDGIQIGGHAATGVVVTGNRLGTDLVGESDRGNNAAGLRIVGAPGNTIGGTQPGDGNVISANNVDGLDITGAGATGNTVAGNLIGVALQDGVTIPMANSSEGVVLDAPGNTVGGSAGLGTNIIGSNLDNGVLILAGGAGSTITGNLIGTDGTADFGNSHDGVLALGAATIGGDQTSGNVISGNGNDGVEIDADGVAVRGNVIGLNAAQTAAVANSVNGVQVDSGAGTVIGSVQTGAGNVIGGNTNDGVNVSGPGADGITIVGNVIGRAPTGGFGNHGNGVELSSVNNAVIGGVASDGISPANVIGSNLGVGVLVHSGTGNSIQGNSISGNLGLGIDLGADGVTANDAKDPDTGANNRQNFPVLSSAVVGGGFLTVAGTLNSVPHTVYTVELFTSTTCDTSGNGEGQTFVDRETLTATKTNGNATIALDIPTAVVTPGLFLTALATSPTGDTSEFSPCVAISEARADLSVSVADSPDPVVHGQNLTYTVTASNLGPSLAHGVTLTQTIGRKLTFVSVASSAGTCDHGGNRVTCDLGVMASGAAVTITVVTQTTVAGTINNSSTLLGATTDPVSSNNVATATTTVT